MASGSRGCPQNNRHLPLSWIKQHIVSEVISIARGCSSELQAGRQPCSLLVLLPFPCSGCCLSLWPHGVGRLPGRGSAESLHVLSFLPLTGLQPVLLQEGLPPLCSGEYQCFPSGNPAGCGEEKRCPQEALQPSLTGWGTEAACAALGWAHHEERTPAGSCVSRVPAALGAKELAKT